MRQVTFFSVLLFATQALSQGTINFNNRVITNVPPILAPISYAAGTPKGGQFGTLITPSTTGATARAGLFAGPDGASENELILIGETLGFRTGPAAGYVNTFPNPLRILNVEGAMVAPGEFAMVQVRAWDTGNTNHTWQQALTNTGSYAGKSILLRIQTGGIGEPPIAPANLAGLQPFSISLSQPPPLVANPIPNQTNVVGALWTFQLPTNAFSSLDPSQVLSYASPVLPSGIFFDAGTLTFRGTLNVPGTYPIDVIATGSSNPPFSATNHFALVLTNRLSLLSINRTGTGFGSVMSSSSNIVCGNTCSALIRDGSVVTLIASSFQGSGFAGWSGACSGTGNCTITIAGDQAVTARFVSTVLDVAVSGGGSVSKTPEKLFYRLGDLVTLTAYPPRWYGVRWNDGLTTNPRVITIGESNQYTAYFYPTTALETVTFNGISRVAPVGMPAIFVNGQFTSETSFTNRGPAEIAIRSSFPEASIHYTLSDTNPSGSGTLYTAPFSVCKDAVVRAVVQTPNSTELIPSDPLALTILPAVFVSTPGGGTVTVGPPGSPFDSNEWATVTAAPAEGWQFMEWRGDAEGTNTMITLPLDRNRRVEAIFGSSIKVRTEGGGSVQQSPASSPLPYGTPVRLTPIPAPESFFVDWMGAVATNSRPLTIVLTNPTPFISARFAPLRVAEDTLTVLTDGGGTVIADPQDARFRSNMRATLTAVPMEGQTFLGWSGSPSDLGDENPISFKMNKTRTVTAHFTRFPKVIAEESQDDCGTGALHTFISGPPDTRYQVEMSTNFVNWTSLGTVTNLYGTVQIRDPLENISASRSYRAIVIQ